MNETGSFVQHHKELRQLDYEAYERLIVQEQRTLEDLTWEGSSDTFNVGTGP